MWVEKIKLCVVGLLMLGLAACGTSTNPTASSSSVPVTTASSVSGYGTVQSINMVPKQQAGIGLGTVAGAVVGGVLGNQIGGGTGRGAATVAGAAGGALAGRQLEKNSANADQAYQVTIRMDNGALQTLTQETQPNLQIGDRVHVENGVIVERLR